MFMLSVLLLFQLFTAKSEVRRLTAPQMKISYRYVLAWLGCAGIMNVYFSRINLRLGDTTY